VLTENPGCIPAEGDFHAWSSSSDQIYFYPATKFIFAVSATGVSLAVRSYAAKPRVGVGALSGLQSAPTAVNIF
jgi:hypothetical protein